MICPQQRTVGDCVSFASTVMLNQFGCYIKQLLVQRGFLIVNNNEDMDINIVGYIIILLHRYEARACYSRNCNSTINKVIKDCPHFKYQIVVILLRFNTVVTIMMIMCSIELRANRDIHINQKLVTLANQKIKVICV